MHFARAWGLAVYKSDTLVGDAPRAVAGRRDARCRDRAARRILPRLGPVRGARCAAEPEAPETVAYTRFVLDRGLAGDLLDLEVALAPCIVGYAEIARERMADPATRRDGNPYRDWLDMYAGAEYQALAREAAAALDEQFATARRRGPLPGAGRHLRRRRPGSKPISGRWASPPPALDLTSIDIDLPATRPTTASSSRCRAASTVGRRRPCWRRAGFEVVGVTLQLYDHGAATGRKGACCAGQDVHDARAVAERLGIPHYVLDYESPVPRRGDRGFRRELPPRRDADPVHPLQRAHQVPRPARRPRATSAPSALATGHYARRVAGPDGAGTAPRPRPGARPELFPLRTTRAELDFLRFPLGGLAKDETRARGARARPAGRRQARQPGHLLRAAGLLRRYRDAAAPGSRRARRHRRLEPAGCSAGITGSRISRSASARGWALAGRRAALCAAARARDAPRRGRPASGAGRDARRARRDELARRRRSPPAPRCRSPAEAALGAAAGRRDGCWPATGSGDAELVLDAPAARSRRARRRCSTTATGCSAAAGSAGRDRRRPRA